MPFPLQTNGGTVLVYRVKHERPEDVEVSLLVGTISLSSARLFRFFCIRQLQYLLNLFHDNQLFLGFSLRLPRRRSHRQCYFTVTCCDVIHPTSICISASFAVLLRLRSLDLWIDKTGTPYSLLRFAAAQNEVRDGMGESLASSPPIGWRRRGGQRMLACRSH